MKSPADILDEKLKQDREENPSRMRKIGRRVVTPLVTLVAGVTSVAVIHDAAHTSDQDTSVPKSTEMHKVVHIGDTIYKEDGRPAVLNTLWDVAVYSGLSEDPRNVLPMLEDQLPEGAVNNTVFNGEEFSLPEKALIGVDTKVLPGEPR